MYRPVKNLYNFIIGNLNSRNQNKINDEFAVINENVHDLVYANTEMTNQIQWQNEQLKNLFLLKLYQGSERLDSVYGRMKELGLSPEGRLLCTMSITNRYP